jgi:hypothetical protein
MSKMSCTWFLLFFEFKALQLTEAIKGRYTLFVKKEKLSSQKWAGNTKRFSTDFDIQFVINKASSYHIL